MVEKLKLTHAWLPFITPDRSVIQATLLILGIFGLNCASAQTKNYNEIPDCNFSYEDFTEVRSRLESLRNAGEDWKNFDYNLGPEELKEMSCRLVNSQIAIFSADDFAQPILKRMRAAIESESTCRIPSGSGTWGSLPQDKQRAIVEYNELERTRRSVIYGFNGYMDAYMNKGDSGIQGFKTTLDLCTNQVSHTLPEKPYNELVFDACTAYKKDKLRRYEVFKNCACLAENTVATPITRHRFKELFNQSRYTESDRWRLYAATFMGGKFPKALACLNGSEKYLSSRTLEPVSNHSTLVYDYMVNGAKRFFRDERQDCEVLWGNIGKAFDKQPKGVCSAAEWFNEFEGDFYSTIAEKKPPFVKSEWEEMESSCENEALRPGYLSWELCSLQSFGFLNRKEVMVASMALANSRYSELPELKSGSCKGYLDMLEYTNPGDRSFYHMSLVNFKAGFEEWNTLYGTYCLDEYFEAAFLSL